MKDGLPEGLDQLVLWNAMLAAMADGVPLPGRGRARVTVADAGAGAGAVFAVMTDAGRLFVQARHLPLAGLTRSALDGAALERLPVALADAVRKLALEQVVAACGAAVAGRIQSVQPATVAEMAGEAWLQAELDGGWGEAAVFLLAAERSVLLALARGALPVARNGAIAPAVAGRIPLRCGLRLLGPDLTAARLAGLARGDMVLARGGLCLVAPHGRFRVLRGDGVLTIGEVMMDDDLPAAGPGGEDATVLGAIDAVPVRLSFLLAEQVMTLAEVQGLTRGSVLPLAATEVEAGRAVRILANGQAIGQGHLVEIDGQTAVRIAGLFGRD